MKKNISVLFIIAASFFVSAAYATTSLMDISKENVVNFYNDVTNAKNFDAAFQYIGSRYKQHNPTAADGVEGLKGYIQWLHDNYPNAHSEIKKIFVDGDYVILHVHFVLEPGTRGLAIVDIFKLEQNKIIEHWDVIQDIPEHPANDNGMF